MRLFSVRLALGLAILTPTGLAQVDAFVVTHQVRRLEANAEADDLVTFLSDFDQDSAMGSAPFSESVLVDIQHPEVTVTCGMDQVSEILPNGVRARSSGFGTATRSGGLWLVGGAAMSFVRIEFDVTRKSRFDFDGSMSVFDSANGSIVFTGPGMAINEDLSGPSTTVSFDENGILEPGSYVLDIFLAAGVFSDFQPADYASGDFDFSLDLEPLTNSYCVTSPNSFGPGAELWYAGSESVFADDFTLRATGSVPNQLGIFYYGDQQVSVPFGGGQRCVGGTTYRLPVALADGQGVATRAVPLGGSGAGSIQPGDTWNFQWWYRDPASTPVFNLSQGIEVEFCQ